MSAFLSQFNRLRDKWLPHLGVSLQILGHPTSETCRYCKLADFAVSVDTSFNVVGGNQGYDSGGKLEVNKKIQRLSETGVSGKSLVLNNLLQYKLDKTSLLDLYKTGRFSLKSYKHSCLITCNTCSGRGKVTCGRCSGTGSVTEFYQAHVRDSVYRDHKGNITGSYPIYETRSRPSLCLSCAGSGWQRCGTCNGDGVNTYIQTANFYSQCKNSKISFQKFSVVTWANEFIENRTNEHVNINEAVDWDLNSQTIQEKDRPGIYHVYLPGTLTASEGIIEANSSYVSRTTGKCKMLGAIPYDTNFVFDQHICWDNTKDFSIPLTGEAISPIISNPLVEACVKDMDYKHVPRGDLLYLNMITTETSRSLQWLVNKLYVIHKDTREKISVLSILQSTIFVATILVMLAITSIMIFKYFDFDFDFDFKYFGILPMIQTTLSFADQVFQRSIAQIHEGIDWWMIFYLSSGFLPAMLLMRIFGSNRNLTADRMMKWYIFGGSFVFISGMQLTSFFNFDNYYYSSNRFIDFILFSMLGGLLRARKKSFAKERLDVKAYNSRRLMQLLEYEE